jgi:hypothetical protein
MKSGIGKMMNEERRERRGSFLRVSRSILTVFSLTALAVLIPAGSSLAAGNELTHYKSGISLMPGGTDGVDYVFERFYHDPLVDDHGVIYIKAATSITLAHNSMNRYDNGAVVGVNGADGLPDSGDEGIIRYKVDMDWSWKWTWSDARTPGDMNETNKCPRYTTPFSFDTLRYFDGAAVLGSAGPSESMSPYPQMGTKTFYFRGLPDEFGDEWHIITVGDDDSFLGTKVKYSNWASDGKIFYFVVNPKTPCLTFSKLTSTAQWYTTPAKGYFVPKIHAQTTYLSDDIAITLQNITDSQGIQYRIDEFGSAWIDYTGPVNVNILGFTSNTVYSFRYRIGTTGPQKVRKLSFKPSYPSDIEPHPSKVLWKNDQDRLRTVNLIRSNAIYTANFNQLLGPFRGGHGAYAQPLMTGSRLVECYASANAFTVYIDGFNAHPLQEQLTRDYMLDNILNLDPIGFERSHNDANPCREVVYHGYYYVVTPLAVATAYDLLIKTNRYPDRPLGFTAIEDYKIRDNLAAFAMTSLQLERPDWPDRPGWPNRTAVPYSYGVSNAGMWATAREIGLQIVSMTMPSYDTAYYGTSGSAGTSATHLWTPYPDVPRSWFEISSSKELGAGIWHMVSDTDTPQWGDREGYWGGGMMGWLFYTLSNARANFDGYHWGHLERAYQLAMDNQLQALKRPSTDDGWIQFYSGLVINEHFPQLARQTYDVLSATTTVEEKSLSNAMWSRGVYGLCYMRLDWEKYPVLADTDGDGLPDSWEALYFGGTTNAHPAALAANGVNTLYESYVAGLNPTNNRSVLTFSINQSSSQNVFQWSAVSGRVYSVYWTTNLLTGFHPSETNIIWPQSSWTDALNCANAESFYQIKVRMHPQ